MAITEHDPTSPRVGQRMTLEEFLELPEEKPYLELIDGVVRQKVSPKFRHGLLQFNFAARISSFVREHQLGVVVTETRFVRPNWAPVSDIGFYRWDRLPLLPDGEPEEDDWIAPDLAIEILSPGQSVGDLVRKCSWFVDNGVRVALMVNGRERSVLVFRPNTPVRVLKDTDRIDLDDVLPGFEMTVADLFDLLILRRPSRGDATTE